MIVEVAGRARWMAEGVAAALNRPGEPLLARVRRVPSRRRVLIRRNWTSRSPRASSRCSS